MCLCLTIITVDDTVLNVAIPTLVRHLQADASQLQWAVDAYLLVYASLLFAGGALSDRYGRRRVLLWGLTLFGLASLVAAHVDNPDHLTVARGFMGLGSALIMPATLAILVSVFSADEQGRAIGIWNGAAGFGIFLGPVLAGWLLLHFWWGSIFLINVPVVLASLVGTLWLVPESTLERAPPLDLPGALLSVLFLGTLLGVIIELPSHGLTSPVILASGVAAVFSLLGFLAWERRAPAPMLDLEALLRPTVAVPACVLGLLYFVYAGLSFGYTQHLQFGLGLSTLVTGLVFLPTQIAWSLSAVLADPLSKRVGARPALVGSSLLVSVTCAGLALTANSLGALGTAIILCLVGLGLGAPTTVPTQMIMDEFSAEHSGAGSALNDASHQVGAAFGIGVVGSVLSSLYQAGMVHHGDFLQPALIESASDNMGQALLISQHLPVESRDALLALARGSFDAAFLTVLWVCAAAALLGAVLSLKVGLRSEPSRSA